MEAIEKWKTSWETPESNLLDDLKTYIDIIYKQYEERYGITIPDHYKKDKLLSEMEKDLK